MSRIAYVNGQYCLHGQAMVHIEDRGFQFADGVYEVCAVNAGRIVDLSPHLDRLERSLRSLDIAPPMGRQAMSVVLVEVVRRNRIDNGLIYFQVTRGVARREFFFPTKKHSTFVVTARGIDRALGEKMAATGVKVISRADIRWRRPDIKSVSLLPNVLAKQAAKENGAYEAWLLDDKGYVTEGSSSNAWIVDQDGNLITRVADQSILSGITRLTVKGFAELRQIKIIERPFSIEEAQSAREAFMTSTNAFVMPITEIDGKRVGTGAPGVIASALRAIYLQHMTDSGK